MSEAPAPSAVTINIDIPGIQHIALAGVNRAAFFMGFALNAVARDDFNDYQLGNLPLIERSRRAAHSLPSR